MKRYLVSTTAALVFFSTAISAQTFKGHRLGESAHEFFASEPTFHDRLPGCRGGAPQPLTPVQVHALPKAEEEELSRQVFTSQDRLGGAYKWKSAPSRSELEQMARDGRPLILDHRLPAVAKFCDSITTAVAQPDFTGALRDPEVVPPVSWTFEKGKLTSIDIAVEGALFSTTVADLTSRLNSKPEETQTIDPQSENILRQAQWLTPSVFARLEERSLTTQEITVMTRAAYNALSIGHRRPSSLD